MFFLRAKHIILHYEGFFEDFQNQRYINICKPLRERKRERESERKRERERGGARARVRARARARMRKRKKMRKRGRENKSAGDHISKQPGPK